MLGRCYVVTMPHGQGEGELVRRALSGDRQAWAEIQRRVESSVHFWSRQYAEKLPSHLVGRSMREDLEQEAWAQIWRKLDTFDSAYGATLRTYFARVAKNRIHDACQELRRQRDVPLSVSSTGETSEGLEAEGSDPTSDDFDALDERFRAEDWFASFRDALGHLKAHNPQWFEVVVLRDFDGLANNDVAGRLQISDNQVASAYRKGMQFVREWLIDTVDAVAPQVVATALARLHREQPLLANIYEMRNSGCGWTEIQQANGLDNVDQAKGGYFDAIKALVEAVRDVIENEGERDG
jgi:RNA polymerase sigma factor (sigma-70 family)